VEAPGLARIGTEFGATPRWLSDRSRSARRLVFVVRNIHNLPRCARPELAADELTPRQLADRLGVSRSAVYYWIRHDRLQARQAPRAR
jgi:hypothetical protein